MCLPKFAYFSLYLMDANQSGVLSRVPKESAPGFRIPTTLDPKGSQQTASATKMHGALAFLRGCWIYEHLPPAVSLPEPLATRSEAAGFKNRSSVNAP